MRSAAESLGLRQANPTVYYMIKEVTKPYMTPHGSSTGTSAMSTLLPMIDFNQFLTALTNHLGNAQDQKGVK